MLIDTSMKVVLKMLFLAFNNINVKFTELEKLTWRSYTTTKALPTITRIEFINKKGICKCDTGQEFGNFRRVYINPRGH